MDELGFLLIRNVRIWPEISVRAFCASKIEGIFFNNSITLFFVT